MSEIWNEILAEKERSDDLFLHKLLSKYIDGSESIAEVVLTILCETLPDAILSRDELSSLIEAEVYRLEPTILADLKASREKDFAASSYLEILLLGRGFHAVTSYRVAHGLWKNGLVFEAKWLSKRIGEIYFIDIHPAAEIGEGLVIDHCFGVVIGETVKVGKNAFIFHNVTLGSKATERGDRHPKVGDHVMIGTGATLLGNILVGDDATIAAGAVVLNDVPTKTVVAGVPATVVHLSN